MATSSNICANCKHKQELHLGEIVKVACGLYGCRCQQFTPSEVTRMEHKPNCASNIQQCAVYHTDGICPGYKKCDCKGTQPSEVKRSACELSKKCDVKDCHNGFITRYIGGSIDSEACPCKCHQPCELAPGKEPHLVRPEEITEEDIKEILTPKPKEQPFTEPIEEIVRLFREHYVWKNGEYRHEPEILEDFIRTQFPKYAAKEVEAMKKEWFNGRPVIDVQEASAMIARAEEVAFENGRKFERSANINTAFSTAEATYEVLLDKANAEGAQAEQLNASGS